MSATSFTLMRALALGVSAVLAGCSPAADPTQAPAAPTATAPATPAAPVAQVSRTAQLQAFLAERYGKAAQLSKGWRGEWTQDGESRATDWQVCAEQPVVSGNSWQQLLAVCGELVDAGHGDPGTVDFYVLRPGTERLEVAAELTGGTYGSSGRPGTVSIIRAGSDFYGFRSESGWYGQGYAMELQSLILPGPNGLVDTGSVRSHIDNTAAYDCDDADSAEDCRTRVFNIDLAMRFDDSDRAARVWPLVLEETGSDCGGTPIRRQHRFTLDPKRWTYAFPDSLQREGCQ